MEKTILYYSDPHVKAVRKPYVIVHSVQSYTVYPVIDLMTGSENDRIMLILDKWVKTIL